MEDAAVGKLTSNSDTVNPSLLAWWRAGGWRGRGCSVAQAKLHPSRKWRQYLLNREPGSRTSGEVRL